MSFYTKLPLVAVFLFTIISLSASELKLSNPILFKDEANGETQLYAQVTVSWENAWHNEKNHDAVWLFYKFLRKDGNGYVHAYFLPETAQIIETYNSSPSVGIQASKDQTGLFIFADRPYRGPVKAKIQVQIDQRKLGRFNPQGGKLKAYGLEMVYIPSGAFTLGDPSERARHYSSFFTSDENGEPAGLYNVVAEETSIPIGAEKGNLYYLSQNQYRGDQQGELGPKFPKGFQPFYIMKYEPTQGLYADFLNSLGKTQGQLRVNFGGKGYYSHRGSIHTKDDHYEAKYPDRPNNFMGWDDAMALADWSGLRPMTELEFTKACRGPDAPIATQYPWGNASKAKVDRVVNLEDNLILQNGWSEAQLEDKNRENFGASYYWVMDLAGSLWERVVSVGHPIGRAFEGSHGDGRITYYGFATNEDWPKGDTEIGGFGYRGGGYYTHGQPYSEFNPYSPIAYRPYGAWAGGDRTEAYGGRFVRTAEE
ncbi:MAG: SUMF1/EgtB/PvdO family nonheme iron enzyme [Saprospiraceae bacterium]|nr:SUMF1/EgtB/PvdO family nonheme iron enzyme [Saprospiraceae bacterium]